MAQLAHQPIGTPIQQMVLDPVCGMPVDPADAVASRTLGTVTHSYYSERCVRQFDRNHATSMTTGVGVPSVLKRIELLSGPVEAGTQRPQIEQGHPARRHLAVQGAALGQQLARVARPVLAGLRIVLLAADAVDQHINRAQPTRQPPFGDEIAKGGDVGGAEAAHHVIGAKLQEDARRAAVALLGRGELAQEILESIEAP